jgi:L-asparaginase II
MRQPVVECGRSGLLESRHPVSAVLIERGAVRWQVGEDLASFWRSACKPLQLSTALRQLSADVVTTLSDEELALGAASHSGQAEHTALVAALLERFGLDAADLQCGAHPPMHEPTARRVPAPTVLHSNCSGKHTFMLAACLARGWPLDYRPPDHPLQQLNRALLDELGGVSHGVSIDGCSVPTFHAPLSAQARVFWHVAEAMAGRGDPLLGRIGWAMQRAPFYMSGSDRLDLAVVERAAEPLTVKVGAEGLFCIARPLQSQALAIKVHSGNGDALAVAVRALLDRVGVPLEGDWPWATVRNVRDVPVGERHLVWA